MALRMIVQTLGFVVFLGLLLFAPAWTFAWPQAWAFLALMAGLCLGVGFWLLRADPGLLEERMKPVVHHQQSPRDRVLMSVTALIVAAWLPFMALDARQFAWSHVPWWASALGAVIVVWVFWAATRVFAANSYASPVVRVQAERGQTVISTGPYAVVRHPMYAGAAPFFIGVPLLLGSWWGLIVAPLMLVILGVRALGEEAVLRRDLAGYGEYAAKVRFRLIPGVW